MNLIHCTCLAPSLNRITKKVESKFYLNTCRLYCQKLFPKQGICVIDFVKCKIINPNERIGKNKDNFIKVVNKKEGFTVLPYINNIMEVLTKLLI